MLAQLISQRLLRLPNKTTLNLWFDGILLIVFAATAITAFVDKQLHVWCGLASVPTMTIHLLLHQALIRNFLKRLWRLELRFRWKLVLDALLFMVFVPLILSGLVVTLIYAPSVSGFHENAFYIFTSLIALHLFTNRKWLFSKLRCISRK